MKILESATFTELLTFDDKNVSHSMWMKKHEKLEDDLLLIRIDKETKTLIKHNNYIKSSLYWGVISVDLTHCNIEIELPNPCDGIDNFNTIRNKMIKRIETVLKAAYGAESLYTKESL